MKGQTPPRHGVPGGWPDWPGHAATLRSQTARLAPAGESGVGKVVMPARLSDAFLTDFPDPGIQQLALHTSQFYRPNLAVGSVIAITSLSVPIGMVYVLTDVMFFALAPGANIWGGSDKVPEGALSGFLRFELLFSARPPLQLEGFFINPVAGLNRVLGQRSGWPWMDRTFGVQRAPAFAVYAKENIQLEARATIDEVPQVPLTTLGVELHGFSVAMNIFSDLFKMQ